MDKPAVDTAGQVSRDRSSLVNESLRNTKTVVCQRCGSKVLLPGIGVLIQKELFLPSMRKKDAVLDGDVVAPPVNEVDGDALHDHWLVENMYAFENVGFTKNTGNIKYLVCADCEIGPIGWHCTDDTKSFYVALDRVDHM